MPAMQGMGRKTGGSDGAEVTKDASHPEETRKPSHLGWGGRLHDDPPDDIQIAFGRRAWFFDHGARTIHRIGIFRGLAWLLPLHLVTEEYSAVQITLAGKDRYTMVLGHYHPGETENQVHWREAAKYTGVPLAGLKDQYVAVVGE